ncbi:MAG: hypothetical protein UU93_C0006G0023 [Candidatus Amesbacteria bacterium GW2011_GWA2_42_12]|uniref:DUF6922 domain-containing protein n=1 Tax=Candidatus Amesbacteria bacterium GW2011_GWA2_42_12 TaxID=1618356 RepID=A0A0G0Y731_9BACT|nr:MAG: hypothetical protein UU93_C0006G0023 [Candidatus Amesbacteria bacterium GW2011_GWA2_42_12]
MKTTKLPEFLKPYFWDVEFDSIQLQKSGYFVIKRVLDRGDTKSVLWLRKNFSDREIAEVLSKSKDLSRPTGNFWADILHLDKTQLPCLIKPYSRIHFGLYS